MTSDHYSIEDDIFNASNGLTPYKASDNAHDPINAFLEKHIDMFSQAPSYAEKVSIQREAFAEQVDKIIKRKRFVYKFYYAQKGQEDREEWMPIGEYDVEDKYELWDLEKKLAAKYNSQIKFNKIKANW